MMDDYIQKKFNDLHVTIRRDIADACPGAELAQFCQSLFADPPAGQLIKKGSYKAVARCELMKKPCIIKTYNNKGFSGMVKSAAVPSRGRQEFTAAAFIHRQAIPTAAPLMLVEKKKFGMVRESAVVLEYIAEARELRDFFFYDRAALAAERRSVAEELGRSAARIFQKSIYQYDFALQNFLIRREPDKRFGLYFIDFERVRVKSSITREQKIDVLARLGRVGTEIPLKDRLRFLRGYLAQDPGFAKNVHDFAGELIPATIKAVRDDSRRGRITSMYTHARYDRIRQAELSGLYRKGTDVPVLLSAVATIAGRQAVGQLVVRFEEQPLSLRAVYFEPGEGDYVWAALTALKIAGMPLDLPHAMVCSENKDCLLFELGFARHCRSLLSLSNRSMQFVLNHFPAEISELKSLLAKI